MASTFPFIDLQRMMDANSGSCTYMTASGVPELFPSYTDAALTSATLRDFVTWYQNKDGGMKVCRRCEEPPRVGTERFVCDSRTYTGFEVDDQKRIVRIEEYLPWEHEGPNNGRFVDIRYNPPVIPSNRVTRMLVRVFSWAW